MATEIKSISSFILQDLDLSNPIIKPGKKAYVVLVKQNWCGYCKSYVDAYNKYANDLSSDYQLLYIEGTSNEDILKAWSNLIHPIFEIKGFPTLLVFNKKGKYEFEVQNRFKLDEELNSKLAV